MVNKGGRPRAVIDKKQFESLCGIQCTQEEICLVLDVTDKTLQKWCKETYGVGFSEVFSQKKEIGKASLRRMQWKHAEKSVPMAIFLGKQYLGQSDKTEETIKADVQTNALNSVSTEDLKELRKKLMNNE